MTLVTSTATANPQSESQGYIVEHTIESGQVLHQIAIKYNTTTAKILELNPDLEPSKLRIGQKIKIQPNTIAAKPAEEAPATDIKPAEEKPVVEQKPVEEKPATEAKSAEQKPATQKPATENKPAAEKKPAAATVSGNIIEHTVESGQFLNRIATKYNTTTAKILELNPGLEPDKIRPGQKIKVPNNGSTPKPTVEQKPAAEQKPTTEAKPSKPATEAKPAEKKPTTAPVEKPQEVAKATANETVNEEAQTNFIVHTVAQGETFSLIVVKYHTTTVRILKLNPGLEPAKVYVGQKIKIPSTAQAKPKSTTTTSSSGEYVMHTIEEGQYLSQIAVKYNTTTAKILELNPGLNADNIRSGQKIKVAKKATTTKSTTSESSNGTYHTVVSGDTLGNIAYKYNMTIADIESLNPGITATILQIGQRIRIK